MYLKLNNQKFLFLHVGQTAGTSVEYFFYSLLKNKKIDYNLNYDTFEIGKFKYTKTITDFGFKLFQKRTNFWSHGHNTIDFYRKKTNISNSVIFSIIRNPYNKLLAKFFCSYEYSKDLKTFDEAKIKFENFLKEMYEKKTRFANEQFIHNRCQTYMICENNTYIDNILKFENLSNDFHDFQKRNFLPELPLLKINSLKHEFKTMDLYTNKGKEIVYQNNREIIDKFYEKLN